jgi:hypothetical protein
MNSASRIITVVVGVGLALALAVGMVLQVATATSRRGAAVDRARRGAGQVIELPPIIVTPAPAAVDSSPPR